MKYYLFYRYAEQVSILDEVLVLENANLTPATVVNITTFNMQGDNDSKIHLCCFLNYFIAHLKIFNNIGNMTLILKDISNIYHRYWHS